MNDMNANGMKSNKIMLIISGLVIVVLVAIFGFNIYNESKVVKINSADIVITESPGTNENEKIITVDAGDKVIFYSFDGGKTFQTENTYTVIGNQLLHIVLKDSQQRVVGEKDYNVGFAIDVTGITLDKTELRMTVDKTENLTATIIPADATNQRIIWTSSDESVATVERGKVTSKKIGTAIITATAYNGMSTTCTVIVSNPVSVTGVSLNKTDLSLFVGRSETLTATIIPAEATDHKITWSSSDESIATVSKGKVTGKKAGTATITATTSNGKKATCKVTVSNIDVTGISLDKQDLRVVVGMSETLTATIIPAEATDHKITWSSSNTGVATVENGKVTGKKAGTTTITATTNNGIKAICNVTVTNPVAVTGISLNKTSLKLYVGKNETLIATISPSDASDKTVTWTSSDTSIATVSNGKVTGKKAGTVTITAKSSNGKKATCKVTVSNIDVTGITLDKTTLNLYTGDSATLTATIEPADATNKTVTWTSSDTNIATVSNGKVTAKKAGTATITAKSNNGKTATCTVTITTSTAVTSVALNKTEAYIVVGGSETLTATIKPSNATNKTITWTSSDTSIATVSNGTVTGKKAGTVTITAKSNNGKTATCKVVVSNVAVTSVSLNKTSSTLYIGTSETLTATVSPANATNKTITWTSSDTSVATVSNGKVTAKKVGTATITAKANNGKKATCTITVTNNEVAVTEVALNKTSTILVIGQTDTLTATVSPANATNKTITWTSSNNGIATVSNGKVTAKSAGTATITAKSSNGKTATCTVIVLAKQKLIDVRNMSFFTYIRKVYPGALGPQKENYQYFGFKNFNQPGETLYITNKYVGSSGKEQMKLRSSEIYDRVRKFDASGTNNVAKWTTITNFSNYYTHGQGFDIELSPNGDQWLMFLKAATEPGGTESLKVFREGEKTAWKSYPTLGGQPTIDRENDLIAMVTSKKCKIYKYSDLINNDKLTLLYQFDFTISDDINRNGFQIKDGYLYEIRGIYGNNSIEVWDYLGNRIIYRNLPLISGKQNEPQGIQIYNGTIYIGVTEFGTGLDWYYTIGYLQ